MQGNELANLLSKEIELIISEQHVAAEVDVTIGGESDGPFIEVHPSLSSDAPMMTIHVLDADSVAVSIGMSSADWIDSSEAIVTTIRTLALAMFQGRLSEEVTRGRSGEMVGSKLLIASETGTKTLWTRASAARLGFKSRSSEVRPFPAYPSSP